MRGNLPRICSVQDEVLYPIHLTVRAAGLGNSAPRSSPSRPSPSRSSWGCASQGPSAIGTLRQKNPHRRRPSPSPSPSPSRARSSAAARPVDKLTRGQASRQRRVRAEQEEGGRAADRRAPPRGPGDRGRRAVGGLRGDAGRRRAQPALRRGRHDARRCAPRPARARAPRGDPARDRGLTPSAGPRSRPTSSAARGTRAARRRGRRLHPGARGGRSGLVRDLHRDHRRPRLRGRRHAVPFTIQSISKPLCLRPRARRTAGARPCREGRRRADRRRVQLDQPRARHRPAAQPDDQRGRDRGGLARRRAPARRALRTRPRDVLALRRPAARRRRGRVRSERETGTATARSATCCATSTILATTPRARSTCYFRQCSILVDCRDLGIMAATLANGGVNPVTGERALARRARRAACSAS